MTYDYKVEPIPKLSGRLLSAKSIGSKSAELLQKVLETEAKADWEFLDIKTIKIPIKKSFFRSAKEITVSLLFFRKLKNPESLKETYSEDVTIKFPKEKLPSLGPALKK